MEKLTLLEVRKRKEELNNVDLDKASLEEIETNTTELRKLNERETALLAAGEERKKLMHSVANDESLVVEKEFKEERGSNMPKQFDEHSAEYRSAFLNKLRGLDLTETEERAYTNVVEKRAFTTATGSAGAVVPETLINQVIEVIDQHAPLLSEINLLRVPGGVTIPIEDVVSAASTHAENATIAVSDDKLKNVSLFAYEVTKLLQISKSVKNMTINAFENWLANNLGRSLSAKITDLILNGTGTGEAAGISTILFGDDNSITPTETLTSQDVFDLIGILPGQYDANAKFFMSKKTLFSHFAGLEDTSKNRLVVSEGRTYYIQGYPVLLDDHMPLGEAYLADLSAGYYGNMPESVNIVNQFDINTNSYKYLGAAMFDGKPVVERAFVKLNKPSPAI